MKKNRVNIPYVNLNLQWKKEKKLLLKVINDTLENDGWVGGKHIYNFEKNIANLCKTKYAISLNSGTDALTLGLHLLGVRRGDEVITTPNSFIASSAVIVHLGAIPVFVDVLNDQNMDPDKLKVAINSFGRFVLSNLFQNFLRFFCLK